MFDAEPHYRMEESGKEDIEREREGVAELARVIAELDREAAEKEAGIRELQAQKERQSGCEVKNLAERADGLSKKCALSLTLYICPACICRVLSHGCTLACLLLWAWLLDRHMFTKPVALCYAPVCKPCAPLSSPVPKDDRVPQLRGIATSGPRYRHRGLGCWRHGTYIADLRD